MTTSVRASRPGPEADDHAGSDVIVDRLAPGAFLDETICKNVSFFWRQSKHLAGDCSPQLKWSPQQFIRQMGKGSGGGIAGPNHNQPFPHPPRGVMEGWDDSGPKANTRLYPTSFFNSSWDSPAPAAREADCGCSNPHPEFYGNDRSSGVL